MSANLRPLLLSNTSVAGRSAIHARLRRPQIPTRRTAGYTPRFLRKRLAPSTSRIEREHKPYALDAKALAFRNVRREEDDESIRDAVERERTDPKTTRFFGYCARLGGRPYPTVNQDITSNFLFLYNVWYKWENDDSIKRQTFETVSRSRLIRHTATVLY